MIKVHHKDGTTYSYDLSVPEEREKWNANITDPKYTGAVTGMGVHHGRVYHTLPLPKRFRKISYDANLLVGKNGSKHEGKVVAEVLRCQADNVLIRLIVYHTNRMTRCDVMKIGHPRFKKPREVEDSVVKIKDHPDFKKLKEKGVDD